MEYAILVLEFVFVASVFLLLSYKRAQCDISIRKMDFTEWTLALHAGEMVAVLSLGMLGRGLPQTLYDIALLCIVFEPPLALVASVVSLPSVFVRFAQKQFGMATFELALLACVVLSAGIFVVSVAACCA